MTQKIPYDRFLILVVLSLLAVGLVAVFSASSIVSNQLYESHTHIFFRQLVAVLLGIMALAVTMQIDYRLYIRPWVLWPLVATAILLLLIPIVLRLEANGVYRWIIVGPFRFQPSEMAKYVALCLMVRFLVLRGESARLFSRHTALYFGAAGTLIALILIGPDLGTAAVVTLSTGLLCFLAGLRLRFLAACAMAGLPLFYWLVLLVPYRRDRILAFLSSEEDPLGLGYQVTQSLISVGSGGLSGVGVAGGTQKLFFLPEAHTDFIFAVVGEEAGLIGCLVIIFLYCLFFWRGVRISLRANSLCGTLLGLGIVSSIAVQAFLNISVVLKLLPTKGIPLPFISVGGSSTLVLLAAIGVLLNISKQARPLTKDGLLPLRLDAI